MIEKRPLILVLILILLIIVPAIVFADGMAMVDSSLVGTWSWISADTPTGNLTPVGEAMYTVTFTADGDIHMKFEQNAINGVYEADGRILTIIPPMAMTMAAWQIDSPAPALIKMMEGSRDYSVSGDSLTVDTSPAIGSMKFERE